MDAEHQDDQLPGACRTADELHEWIRRFLEIDVPRRPVCRGHQAPFEYLWRAYFEPARDLVVWAPRGGGKTRLGAAATLLDLLHKPGCGVRILGGSLDQSLRMWEHLVPDLQRVAEAQIAKQSRSTRRIILTSGSSAAVLTQSQRAVRGLRVQKLRCDEVELFDPRVWEAAQLVTRSRGGGNVGDGSIVGAVEAISTLHTPGGLMQRIVDQADGRGAAVIRWCLLEVLERCPPQRDCGTCPLWDDCGGAAKTRCSGFVTIDDAIRLKQRVSRETWEAEMLCRRPSLRHAVFPQFDPAVHASAGARLVSPAMDDALAAPAHLAIDFGFANAFVCLWVSELDGHTFVIDEYVQPGRTVAEHLQQIRSRLWPLTQRIACDPAGAGRNEQTAESNVALLRREGFVVRYRRSLIVEGLEIIRAALRPAAGEPRLFIHPRCKRLIAAMQQYRYAPGGSELPVKDGEHDHLIDALRYYFINRPSPGALQPPRRY